ncbi:MAG: hypothetical protein JW716_01060 [Candidatus Aenigmarchaeota archaeon]|nr:hypothetical protein [Candidatus Aenigmarchaeota archaeon]
MPEEKNTMTIELEDGTKIVIEGNGKPETYRIRDTDFMIGFVWRSAGKGTRMSSLSPVPGIGKYPHGIEAGTVKKSYRSRICNFSGTYANTVFESGVPISILVSYEQR